MSMSTNLYDDESLALDCPNIKTICRGKVKVSGCVDLSSADLLHRQLHSLAFSSKYGVLLHSSGSAINASKWSGIEEQYRKVESVQLQKANQALIKETIDSVSVFITFKALAPYPSLLLSPTEERFVAWASGASHHVAVYSIGGSGEPLWSVKTFVVDVLAVAFNFDGSLLAVLEDCDDFCVVHVFDATTGSVVAKQQCGLSLGMCFSPTQNVLAVGQATGKGVVEFFQLEGKELKSLWQLEVWNTPEEEVEYEDLTEIHTIAWPVVDTLIVGHRAIPGTSDPPLPFLIIYSIQDNSAINAWFVDNPLDFNEDNDKDWRHVFHLSYVTSMEAVVVASSWSQNVAVIGKSDNEWKRWVVSTASGDNSSLFPEVLSSSFHSLSDSPWRWKTDRNETKHLDSKVYPVGCQLCMCSKSSIPPFFILGAGRELDDVPDFAPPPTLLLATTDGFVDVVALANRDFALPKTIPGVSSSTLPLPAAEVAATKVETPAASLETGDLRSAKSEIMELRSRAETGMLFIKASEFAGRIQGYVFRQGDDGVGYFKDQPKPIEFKRKGAKTYTFEEAQRLLKLVYSTAQVKKTEEQIQAALEKYKGNFSVMFQKLEAKYKVDVEKLSAEPPVSQTIVADKKVLNETKPPMPELKTEPVIKSETPISQTIPSKASLPAAPPPPVINVPGRSTASSSARASRAKFTTPDIGIGVDSKENKEESDEQLTELKRLRQRCAELEEERVRTLKFETPPKVQLKAITVHSKQVDRIASLNRQDSAGSFASLYSNDKAHVDRILEVLANRMATFKSYSEQVLNSNKNVALDWAQEDKDFEDRGVELAKGTLALHDFVIAQPRKEELSELENKLAALRRNYFQHEYVFQKCHNVVSQKDQQDDFFDDDLAAVLEQIETVMESLQNSVDGVVEDLAFKERKIEEKRKATVEEFKMSSLKQTKVIPKDVELFQQVLQCYQRARKAYQKLKGCGEKIGTLDTELNGSKRNRNSPEKEVIDKPKVSHADMFLYEVGNTLPLDDTIPICGLDGNPIVRVNIVEDDAARSSLKSDRETQRAQRKALAQSLQSPTTMLSNPASAAKSIQDNASVNIVSPTPLNSSMFATPPKYNPLPQEDLALSFEEASDKPAVAEPVQKKQEPLQQQQQPEQPQAPATPVEAAKQPVPEPVTPPQPAPVEQVKPTPVKKEEVVTLADCDLGETLRQFYTAHNPSNVAKIETTLAKYAGREAKLIEGLEKKYRTKVALVKKSGSATGPTTPVVAPQATPSTTAATPPAAAAPSTAFGSVGFGSTNSGGLAQPATATPSSSPFGTATNTGTTFGSTAFGATPAGNSLLSSPTAATNTMQASTFGSSGFVDHRSRLIQFYQKHNPSKLNTVDQVLTKYRGQEAKLFESLNKKYNVMPSPSPAGASTSFGATSTPAFGSSGFGSTAFQQPNTAAQPSTTAFQSTGFGTTSPASTFGATPATPTAFGGSSFGGGGFAAPAQDHRQRLVAFYTQHNPAKLSSVDSVLLKYRGREHELFANLEKKYGKQQQQQQAMGGTAFGSPGFGSSTFGASTPAAQPFGMNTAAPATSGFGSTGFTTGQSSFGTPAFGAPAGNTGSGFTQGVNTGFTTQPNTTGFGGMQNNTTAFGSSNTTAFGGTAGGGFGAQQPNTGFGSNSFTQMRG